MKVQKLNVVRFAPKGQGSFYDYVVANVKSYFRDNKISPYANTEMWVKTAVMLFLYCAVHPDGHRLRIRPSMVVSGFLVHHGNRDERNRNCSYA